MLPRGLLIGGETSGSEYRPDMFQNRHASMGVLDEGSTAAAGGSNSSSLSGIKVKRHIDDGGNIFSFNKKAQEPVISPSKS